PDGQPVAGLPAGTNLIPDVFESDVGVETDPEAYQGGYVWFEVLGITPSRERSFEEVRTDVENRWRAEQVATRLREKAKELVGKLDGGASLEAEATALGI